MSISPTVPLRIGRKWWWLGLLALLPAAGPLFVLSHYHVNMVWNDAWDLGDLLISWEHGTLHFSDFWAFHNEHRMPIPYLIMFVLALLTHWNTYVEVFFGYTMVCVLSWLLFVLLKAAAAGTVTVRQVCQWFLINLLIFSPIQCENWTFGFAACQNFIPIPCLVGAILLLYTSDLTWTILLLCGLLIETASLSLANGLLGWLLVLPMLLLTNPREKRQKKSWYVLAWTAMAVMSLFVQFWGYHAHQWDEQYYAGAMGKRIQFVFAFLGNPFTFEGLGPIDLTIAVGFIIALTYLIIVAWMVWRWMRLDMRRVRRALPWVLLGGYGFGGAMLGALGRVGLGLEHAMTSRYTTIAMLLPLCFIGLMFLPAEDRSRDLRGRRALALFPASVFAAILLVALVLSGWRSRIQYFRRMSLYRSTMAYVAFIDLISLTHADDLTLHVDNLRQRADALNTAGYLQTRLLENSDISALMPAGAEAVAVQAPNGEIAGVEQQQDGFLKMWGWAILHREHRGADLVLVTYDDPNNVSRLCGMTTITYLSDQVAAKFGSEFLISAWSMRFPINRLPPGVHRSRRWAYDAERQLAYPLTGTFEVGS